MKRIKKIEPRIDPWGNPILKGLSEDLALLIVVCDFLSSRNDLSHLIDLPRMRALFVDRNTDSLVWIIMSNFLLMLEKRDIGW